MAVGGVGIFFIVLVTVFLVAFFGWIAYTRIRASRLGLPPPSLNPFAHNTSGSSFPAPAPGGVVGWFNTKVRAFKNRRYASGAYEGTTYQGTAASRGRNPLDPDEAWDTRVGNEADVYGPGGYYEEQELGLQPPNAYGGRGYGAPSPGFAPADHEGRGRSRTRELDERYDEEMGRTGRGQQNPFGDEAEPSDLSLRGVSPRPLETSGSRVDRAKAKAAKGSLDDSPTERRSMFRENM